MKKSLLVFYFLFFISSSLFAQWQKVNIYDASVVSGLTKDSSGFIYFITNNKQLFRSSNNGVTWYNFTNGLNADLMSIISTPTSVLIGTFASGVYRSTNHGLSWINSNSGFSSYYIETFYVKGSYVFAGSQNGIFRSSNDGVNWVFINNEIGFSMGINAIISSGNYIFAESFNGAGDTMYRSTNNGDNWTAANTGLPYFPINSLASSGNKIFACGNAIYQTTNNGLNWTVIPGFPGQCGSVNALGNIVAVNYAYNSSNQYVYMSTNSGNSFYPTGADLPNNGVTTTLITSNGLFAGTHYGVYKSTNLGLNWNAAFSFLSNVDYPGLYAINNYVFAGTTGNGVFKSSNSGVNWEVIYTLTDTSSCYNLFDGGYEIFSQGSYGFVYSTNVGLSWINIPLAGSSAGNLLKYFVCSHIIIGGYVHGVYLTSNFGLNWQIANGIPTNNSHVNTVFNNDYMALVQTLENNTNHVLYKSTNRGINWSIISNSGLESINVQSFFQDYNNFYAETNQGIYLSTNDGNNWISKNNGLPLTTVSNMIIKNGIIYVSTLTSGIYKSTNNGSSWLPYNDGIINNTIYSLASGQTFIFAGGIGALYVINPNTGIHNISSNIPEEFLLFQNYPNPFNPSTIIRFQIKDSRLVNLKVYDILGKEIETLVNEKLQPGTYEVTFNASHYPSGVYFYRLQVGDYNESKKMLLIK